MGFSRSGWSAKSRICAKTSETVQREISLFFHFVGIGLFFTILVAGTILEFQYRKTQSLEARETLLRALKPIGLLSPVATLIMLGSGIGNMTALGAGIFSMGWLTAKIFFSHLSWSAACCSGSSRVNAVLLSSPWYGAKLLKIQASDYRNTISSSPYRMSL